MRIKLGDITALDVDVLVNACHPCLHPGFGFSKVIHDVAGKELEIAARKLAPIQPGNCILTEGFNLNAKYVIHAVAPRFNLGNNEERQLLAQTYHSIMETMQGIAEVKTIAIPSISGVYAWPFDLGAKIAVDTLYQYPEFDITICTFERILQQAFLRELNRLSTKVDH